MARILLEFNQTMVMALMQAKLLFIGLAFSNSTFESTGNTFRRAPGRT